MARALYRFEVTQKVRHKHPEKGPLYHVLLKGAPEDDDPFAPEKALARMSIFAPGKEGAKFRVGEVCFVGFAKEKSRKLEEVEAG